MIIERDAWLSEQLGYEAFRVRCELGAASPDGGDRTGGDPDLYFFAASLPLRATKAQPIFYYAKVPTQYTKIVAALGPLGFRVVDVSITLSCAPRVMTNSFAYKGLLVREVEPDDYAAVLDIAGCCFRYSRFHLDAVFPAAVAHAIKRAWIQSYVDRQRGEQLLVALVNGKPAGFLAVLEATVEGQACRVIDLIGVAQTYQGRGVGRALVGCFLEDCAHRGLGARVGTQAANISSLRLYESLGFRVCETAYVLHAHVGGGGEGVRR